MKKEKYLVNSLYAPNKDILNTQTKQFFEDTMYQEFDHILYAGYYNIAFNHKVDTCGYIHVNNPNLRQYIKSRISMNKLTDIWRESNTSTRAFTFNKKKQDANRTNAWQDYFLVSKST